MEEHISYVAVAIKPPIDACNIIADLSKTIHMQYNTWWCLDTEKFPPHITLWLAYLPTRNIPFVEKALSKILNEIKPLDLTISKSNIDKTGFIGLSIFEIQELKHIHLLLLKKLNKFRENYLHDKYKENFNLYDNETQSSLIKYGTRFADNNFNPHITLNIIKPDQVSNFKMPANVLSLHFEAKEIVFFMQEESGKSVKYISKYNLI